MQDAIQLRTAEVPRVKRPVEQLILCMSLLLLGVGLRVFSPLFPSPACLSTGVALIHTERVSAMLLYSATSLVQVVFCIISMLFPQP